jgi:hypothetical protein
MTTCLVGKPTKAARQLGTGACRRQDGLGWSWAMRCSVSEMTQYSANRPSSTRRRSWPLKLTRVPAGAVAPRMPPF